MLFPPLINDITTDVDDPPGFVQALRDGINRNREMSYPAGRMKAKQMVAYPDIAPWYTGHDPETVLAAAESAMRSLRLEMVGRDREAGRLEARARTPVLRFIDDVVVRVRPVPPGAGAGAGARLDIRSKSRLGLGDFGANARRIRKIMAAVVRELG